MSVLHKCKWCRKHTIFYKIENGLAPKYLANYLNINDNQVYKTRASEHNNKKRFWTWTENLKQSFSPFCFNEWCKLDISQRKNENIKGFKPMLKDFFNLKQKWLLVIHNPPGVKLFSRLRLKFSHLNELIIFVIILKMLCTPCVTKPTKLKQQATFSCVVYFLQ